MLSFSQGKWECQPHDDGLEIGFEVNCDVDNNGGWKAICFCPENHLGTEKVTENEAQANAKLIEQSPNMLRLLGQCQVEIKKLYPDHPLNHKIESVLSILDTI